MGKGTKPEFIGGGMDTGAGTRGTDTGAGTWGTDKGAVGAGV